MERQITGDEDELSRGRMKRGGGGVEKPPDDTRISGHVLGLIPRKNGHSSVKM